MPPVPALENSTVLITGATDGLGRRVAHDLAARGATVLVHGRSRERGEDTVRSIAEETGNERVSLVLADLGSLAQVSDLAERAAGRRRGGLSVRSAPAA